MQNVTLSREEKILVGSLAQAGRSGHWDRVVKLWSKYSGHAAAAHGAAMQAAYHCGHYIEAGEMYDRARSLPNFECSKIIFHRGLKIFGKLRNQIRVEQIWSEVLATGVVNQMLAAARIDAAACMGDIVGAAEGLDYMVSNNWEATVPSFNSAINACRNANPPSPSAANYVYETMLQRNLQPSVVTFTGLVRAHVSSKSSILRKIYLDMKARGIKPDNVFAESFIGAVFKGQTLQVKQGQQITNMLAKMSRTRREILRRALSDFEANKAMTGLVRAVARAAGQKHSSN